MCSRSILVATVRVYNFTFLDIKFQPSIRKDYPMAHHTTLWIILILTFSIQFVVSTRLVCFFDSTASSRSGHGQFTVDNINPHLCTHLIYVSTTIRAILTAQMSNDQKLPLDPTVVKFIALKTKNPKLKTMVSIGSWHDGESAVFEKEVNRGYAFADSALIFLQRYGFDGLDFSWPWQGNPSNTDPDRLLRILTPLKKTLEENGRLLSLTVSANRSVSDESYNIPKINGLVDFVNLKSYNMTGGWMPFADHHAPLHRRKWESDDSNNNVHKTVVYWLKNGLSKAKLNVGIPFFGNSWTLKSNAVFPPAAASGPGPAGESTATPGLLAFNEICLKVRKGNLKAKMNTEGFNGPIAYSQESSGKTWVGYDDPKMVKVKGNYIISEKLGGAVVWDISMDDFNNRCEMGPNPLLVTLAKTLNILDSKSEKLVSGSAQSFSVVSKSLVVIFTQILTFLIL